MTLFFEDKEPLTPVAIATDMEKILCNIVGGWYMEIRVTEFCLYRAYL